MTIPKQLKVGGHTYKVTFPYTFRERSDRSAHADHASLEIVLADRAERGEFARTRIEETFMHEIIHCVDDAYNAGELIDKLGEEGVRRFGEGLYQVLKDNDLLKNEDQAQISVQTHCLGCMARGVTDNFVCNYSCECHKAS